MPSKSKSPFAPQFKSGIKSGKSACAVVCSMSQKTGKPAAAIWQSLYKAGLCFRCKFNSSWLYWPTFKCVSNSKANCNTCQTAMWQCFVDWCCMTGCCTPAQLNSFSSNQKSFMSFCRIFFGMQMSGAAGGSAKSAGMWKSKKTRGSKWQVKSASKWHKKAATPGNRSAKSKKKGKKRSWASSALKPRWTTKSYKWTAKKHTRKSSKPFSAPKSWSINGSTRNYKFPTYKSRSSSTRRYVRAA